MGTLEMPRYHQLPNACGLSSLLMALRPDARAITPILDEFWEKIRNLFREKHWQNRREYLWTRVLEYLLLKGFQAPDFREAFEAAMPEFFELYVIISHDQIQQTHALLLKRFGPRIEPLIEKYYERGLLYEELVLRRILKMKENPELKFLAKIFGCDFVPWPQSWDGTGAVTFTREDLKSYRKNNPSPEFEEKVTFLRKGLKAEDPMLLGSTHHWLAVKDILEFDGKLFLTYHDPANGKEMRRPFDRFGPSDFFYRFTFSSEELQKNAAIARRVIEQDIPAEIQAPPPAKPEQEIDRVVEGVEIQSGDLQELELEAQTTAAAPLEETGERKPIPPEALAGKTIVERLRYIIRASFSDYTKL